MPTVEIDKDGGYIAITEGEVRNRTSIRFDDCVVLVQQSQVVAEQMVWNN